jgi:hypothetical protein
MAHVTLSGACYGNPHKGEPSSKTSRLGEVHLQATPIFAPAAAEGHMLMPSHAYVHAAAACVPAVGCKLRL